MPETRDRVYAYAAVAGFIVFYGLSDILKFGVFGWSWAFSLVTAFLTILLTVEVNLALFLWGRASNQAERQAFLWAVAATELVAIFVQGLYPVMGWLVGPAVDAPIIVQALIYGVSLTGLVAFILTIYRALGRRKRALGSIFYGSIIIGFIPATVLGDAYALNIGVFTFANGYTVWADALYGQLLLWLPLITYEILRRRQTTLTEPIQLRR